MALSCSNLYVLPLLGSPRTINQQHFCRIDKIFSIEKPYSTERPFNEEIRKGVFLFLLSLLQLIIVPQEKPRGISIYIYQDIRLEIQSVLYITQFKFSGDQY